MRGMFTTFYSGIFIAYLCMIFFCAKMRQVRPFHISIPITHFIIYHYQKEKKEFFAMKKSLRVVRLLKDLLGFSLGFSVMRSSLVFSVIGTSLRRQ